MSIADDDELIDAKAACRILGGDDHPIHSATLYRGIKSGIYPAPIKASSNLSRWLKREVCAARAQRIGQRTNRFETEINSPSVGG